ncbi:MAG: 3-dehydroquinate synthase [Thermoanaerobacteraceae bacterium]|nr:3-dehydroquinate synthase [Thermoanaerobacteraceae bacterium]
MAGRLQVELGERSYTIYCGRGILAQIGELLRDLNLGGRCLVVSNPTVVSLYGPKVRESLEKAGFAPLFKEVPDGEEAKSLEVAADIYDLALAAGWERGCPVIALGGGVVGDLAGFVAATLLRGVPFIQLPTTLLAQVDSSVGGKVAVNHPRGKNLIGAFYQPRLVAADLDTLRTLPEREMRAGMAEVIKYGVIFDASFFSYLEEHLEEALGGNTRVLEKIVLHSCRLKAEIVAQDEEERGLRAILNFGHTAGHALEGATGFKLYRHGEAVAVGMMVASWVAAGRGLFAEEELARLEGLLVRAGLPTRMPSLDWEAFGAALIRDKKVREGRLRMVLPVELGRVTIAEVEEEEVLEAAQRLQAGG